MGFFDDIASFFEGLLDQLLELLAPILEFLGIGGDDGE